MLKKLIETSLPLDAINSASAREKSIRHGHPSTLHLWWARRPLAAARAVIFSQMVDDPSGYVEELRADSAAVEAAWRERVRRGEAGGEGADSGSAAPESLDGMLVELERERLFGIIRELVKWENTANEAVLERARGEIRRSWRRTCARNAGHPRAGELFDPERLPAFHDPFAGGGALPLEAQRLGLEAHASDLNPVAVLINKAMIEIPPKFAGKPPVNPAADAGDDYGGGRWRGAMGLAADVRHYGKWMRDEAERRIGHLYPKVEVTSAMVAERPDLKQYQGRKLTVIAWLWARTVKSPNPAFADVDVPLTSTWMLSTKKGKEAYVAPVVGGKSYRFIVRTGASTDASSTKRGTKSGGSGTPFLCLVSGFPIPFEYIRDEAKQGRMGSRLMAVVLEGGRGRVYVAPNSEQEDIAKSALPDWTPESSLPEKALGFRVQQYGMTRWRDLFTDRQLVALTTFSDLVGDAIKRIRQDAEGAGLPADPRPLRDGGTGAAAYAEAVALYLAFAVDKCSDYWNTMATWMPRGTVGHLFARQAIPMTWDFVEAAPLGNFHCAWREATNWVGKALEHLPNQGIGKANQLNATEIKAFNSDCVVSTDPPYYDNIGYADLSDFFYVWLRNSINFFPQIFSTMAAPKKEELVASPYRHGGKEAAEGFFLNGMKNALKRLIEQGHSEFPITIYYAFKQSENKSESGVSSTGWETFLDAAISSGFSITGTWPMRTERSARSTGIGTNALASSIVLVCRRRSASAPTVSRREFVSALKSELPPAIADLQRGNIAPVDLAQAAIGPGMSAYTRHAKVLDATGKPLTVRDALGLINQVLDETLTEQEGDFDEDSRWALSWFEQYGFDTAEFGVAEVLSKAKGTSIAGLAEAGVVETKAGKVRLLKPEELPTDWDPATDTRLTEWEMVHHLIRVLEAQGEGAAAEVAAKLGTRAEAARELCYRLYTVCERKKRAAEGLSYNSLVQSWPEIIRLARASEEAKTADDQLELTI